jgi:hypothetical protein
MSAGIPVLSLPFARRPSPPARSSQPQVALASWDGSAARFGPSAAIERRSVSGEEDWVPYGPATDSRR